MHAAIASDHVSDEIDLPRLVARRRIGAMGDLAVAHHEDGVAEPDRLLQRVGGQDDRDAFAR